TLHPKIHAAILARDTDEDARALERLGIEPFDLVCVNLYPFSQVAARHGATEEEAVEMIDIGGPAMLRGAAKNFVRVAPVCRPEFFAAPRSIGRTSSASPPSAGRSSTAACSTSCARPAGARPRRGAAWRRRRSPRWPPMRLRSPPGSGSATRSRSG